MFPPNWFSFPLLDSVVHLLLTEPHCSLVQAIVRTALSAHPCGRSLDDFCLHCCTFCGCSSAKQSCLCCFCGHIMLFQLTNECLVCLYANMLDLIEPFALLELTSSIFRFTFCVLQCLQNTETINIAKTEKSSSPFVSFAAVNGFRSRWWPIMLNICQDGHYIVLI